jgi:hypothetical protein
MEKCRKFIARAIYHHRSNAPRHITVLVFKDERDSSYGMLSSDSTSTRPECWDGTREEILERWRHANRVLQAEWFLHDQKSNQENDFDEFI